MSEPLEPEVSEALAKENLQPGRFRCISNLRSPGYYRAAYRIELADGRVIKARRLENEAVAHDLLRIRRRLPDAFAPVFTRHGRVLLEEWVLGEPLGDAPPEPARLAEAGVLLGELHAHAQLDGQRLHQVRSTAAHRDSAMRKLQQFVATGALKPGAARELTQAILRLDPGQAKFGLVHLDFCGENMVIDRLGQLRVVDNERMGVDALGFDLARAWHRWALPDAAWETFQSAYAACLPWNDPLKAPTFWRLRAISGAAAVLLRYCPDRAEAPLQALRRLAGELAR